MSQEHKPNLSETAGLVIGSIEKTWQKGVVLSQSSIDFIESSLGITDAFELESILTSGDFPDREMVLELILFPDKETRLRIEPLLPAQGLKKSEVQTIVHCLIRSCSFLTIYYTEASGRHAEKNENSLKSLNSSSNCCPLLRRLQILNSTLWKTYEKEK